MPPSSQTFSVRLPDDIKSQLDQIAELTQRSRSFLIKEAVANYVRERAAYIRALDEAVASAESGIGHSFESISEWMRSWGGDDEKAAPEPDILLKKS